MNKKEIIQRQKLIDELFKSQINIDGVKFDINQIYIPQENLIIVKK